MASVNMSGTLREQITANYRIQLEKAYRKTHQIQPTIDQIGEYLLNVHPSFVKLVEIDEQYIETFKQFNKEKDIDQGYSSPISSSEHIKPIDQLGIICNPNRPPEENMTMIENWHAPYLEMDWNDEEEEKPASDNYVEGDVAVKLDNVNLYSPYKFNLAYERGWRSKGFAPNADFALVVTDKEMCNSLSPIGEIESKLNTEVDKFEKSISSITTLKRFLDEWPAGKSLIPSEYIDRMNKKTVRRKSTATTVEQLIPDELKEEMNEVILTNKLMGE